MTETYNGDTNFNAVSTAAPLVETVTNAAPSFSAVTTTVLTATNPSPSFSTSVTYIFRVTGSSPPQGTVTVTDAIGGAAAGIAECTQVVLVPDPGSLTTSSGSCVVTFNNKDAVHGTGVHLLTATFNTQNSGSWNTSTSTVVTVTVGKPTTSVSRPTVVPAAITVGTNATFSTIVSPTNPAPAYAASTVQFFDNGTPLGAPVTPNAATGVLASTTTPLALGNHNITAQFGDANTGFGDVPFSR